MFRGTFSAGMIALLLLSVIMLAFNIQPAKADAQTVSINADGSISPVGAPISNTSNLYYLTGNIARAGETNIADNSFTGGTFYVGIPGDIDGNGRVNILDAITLANAFNSRPGHSNWNPDADIDCNNVVNILDAITLANHFNEHYP